MAWPYFYPTQLRPESFDEQSWLSPLSQQQQPGQQQQPQQPQPDMNPFAKYKFLPGQGGY